MITITGRLAQPQDRLCWAREDGHRCKCSGKNVVFELRTGSVSKPLAILCRTHRDELHALLGDVCHKATRSNADSLPGQDLEEIDITEK